jgi:opacity protein-like surface antigen
MKKIAMALLIAAICSAPSLASAVTPYVSLSGGLGTMHDSNWTTGAATGTGNQTFKNGLALESAFGVKFDRFRVEAEVGYQSNKLDKLTDTAGANMDVTTSFGNNGKMTTAVQPYMINGYTDFNTKGAVSPFVMAGVGLASIDEKWHNDIDSYNGDWMEYSFFQHVFAWQVGAGVGIKASDKVNVDLSYRYFATADITLAEKATFEVATSNILLGVRYNF